MPVGEENDELRWRNTADGEASRNSRRASPSRFASTYNIAASDTIGVALSAVVDRRNKLQGDPSNPAKRHRSLAVALLVLAVVAVTAAAKNRDGHASHCSGRFSVKIIDGTVVDAVTNKPVGGSRGRSVPEA